MVPAFPRDRGLLSAVIKAGKAAHPSICGLTHVTPTHAVLQVTGDATYYLVEITPVEAYGLGWIDVRGL
jgi:hypothetical protein